MKKLQRLLLLLLLFSSGNAIAQKVVTGKVTNKETGEPLQGVSVIADKSSGGTVTKEDGTFSLKYKSGATKLAFSYIGFTPEVFQLKDQSTIEVKLAAIPADNNEVVVIGYGTQKKSSLTGAVAKYKNDKMDEIPVPRLDQALQGKMAGVQVQNISSEAGAAPKISIRGISSINAGSSPLVVVDGQPIPDGLSFVNPADVESVEVLKDAASAAIYGSRGASGVILITTKSGKAEKPKYNLKYSLGQKRDYRRYEILSTSDYTNLLYAEGAQRYQDSAAYTLGFTAANLLSFRNNKGVLATEAEKAAYIVEQTLMGGQGTDWQSESLRPGLFQNIQLSASGGKKDVQYFISGGYQRDEGMMYKSDFQRYSVRTKLDIRLSDKVKLGLNVNPSYSKRISPSENFTNFYRYPSFLPVYHTDLTARNVNQLAQWANIRPGDFAQPRHFSSIYYSGKMPDGSMWTPVGTSDPFSSAQNTPKSSTISQDIYVNEYRLQGSADLNINILPGLDFKSLASMYLNYTNGLNFANRNATADGSMNRGVYSNTNNIDLLSENTFTYRKTFNKHSINVLAGFTTQKTTISSERTTGLDYPSDNIRTLNNASSIDRAGTFGTKDQIGLVSYLGRINYEYNNKYLLSVSFRTDGSSYFGEGNKWGSFPSISGGWIMSQEKFMQNVNWISRLKLRASYGATGNNRISDFAYLDLLSTGNYPFGGGTGVNTSGQVTSRSNIANSSITWERTFQSNFGFDVSLLKNKISLSFDIYQSKTERLLLQQSVQAIAGVPQYFNNIGSLKNNGFEIELNTTNISKKDFKWTTAFNFSRNRNEIQELGREAFLLNQGERTEVYRARVGDPLVQFFGFKTDGVWLSQADINAARARGLTSSLANVFIPGGLKLVDINGDNIIDNNDRTIIGSPYPEFNYGMTNTFTYKAFDFSFLIQGVQGGNVINGDANYNESRRYITAYSNNRWVSPMFPGDGKTPFSTIGFNWMLTDYVVSDASYLSLREVNLGYRLPSSISKAIKLNSLRVYFAAQNLFFKSASNFRALNPEGRATSGAYSSALIDGYQRGSFPIQKTFVFGIDINF
jgi:TonB-linked SusC/RagA family outer membrane protein